MQHDPNAMSLLGVMVDHALNGSRPRVVVEEALVLVRDGRGWLNASADLPTRASEVLASADAAVELYALVAHRALVHLETVVPVVVLACVASVLLQCALVVVVWRVSRKAPP